MTDDGDAPTEPPREEKSGTFLVTAADEDSAVLSAVGDGRVCPLGSNPGFERGEVVEGTLVSEGPLGMTWRAADVAARWTPDIEAVDESPGERARELADQSGTGRLSRVGTDDGELHVLAVDPGRTEDAVGDVLADETTKRIAARLGARRVDRGAAGSSASGT